MRFKYYLAFMNGWKMAPHQWRIYLTRPVKIDTAPWRDAGWISISMVGIVIFICRRGR